MRKVVCAPGGGLHARPGFLPPHSTFDHPEAPPALSVAPMKVETLSQHSPLGTWYTKALHNYLSNKRNKLKWAKDEKHVYSGGQLDS